MCTCGSSVLPQEWLAGKGDIDSPLSLSICLSVIIPCSKLCSAFLGFLSDCIFAVICLLTDLYIVLYLPFANWIIDYVLLIAACIGKGLLVPFLPLDYRLCFVVLPLFKCFLAASFPIEFTDFNLLPIIPFWGFWTLLIWNPLEFVSGLLLLWIILKLFFLLDSASESFIPDRQSYYADIPKEPNWVGVLNNELVYKYSALCAVCDTSQNYFLQKPSDLQIS